MILRPFCLILAFARINYILYEHNIINYAEFYSKMYYKLKFLSKFNVVISHKESREEHYPP